MGFMLKLTLAVLVLSLELLTPAAGASFPITVFLARHAEKASLPADDPVLSPAGLERAAKLASLLRDSGITAIYTSEKARTQLTAKPLADLLHVNIDQSYKAASSAQALANAILRGQARKVLVVGHSNTVPEIIKALGGGEVPRIEDAWEFDNLYVVTVNGPGNASTVRRHYGEPSRPAANAPGK